MASFRSRFPAFFALFSAMTLALLCVAPASAHHGWSSFDTRHAYFASGTITYVRWGNPHSEVRLKIEDTKLPANWNSRELPPGADESSGRATMKSARPYGGEQKELRLVLAGPGWMERWGLKRPLKVGEKLEVVGFLNSSEDRELRPMMFWLSDGQGVWQQLTSLPQQPEAASGAAK
ncbi:Uncharacterised protein [Achromobacter xylosoxidans]|uniref:DUF6152 family protein n=1 Tax=Alcaligenes xylosoxydans xylosoxydans TaxID=85698 RepID=UPI0006C56666|nr:DUF6152 family protein [Achromobacter xylosoxidans]CUJ39683.1 Uncharacterised protein [Achromobacter xylosoxidans]